MASKHAHPIVVALAGLALFASTALAQYSGGGLWGRGKAGDVVRIESVDTGATREETVTEDNGKYRFERIPIGVYVVTITHADGTQEKPKKVRVQVGTNTFVK